MDLNEDQQKIVDLAVDWYKNSSEQVFQYSGAAGTGKSVTMNAIIQALGLTIDEVIKRLKGIPCGFKGTSCPDQLAIALEKIKEEENK